MTINQEREACEHQHVIGGYCAKCGTKVAFATTVIHEAPTTNMSENNLLPLEQARTTNMSDWR